MDQGLVRYLSSVMRGDAKDELIAHMNDPQSESNLQFQDLVKDRFLVDSKFALYLDEVI
jgi:hypothetical protein